MAKTQIETVRDMMSALQDEIEQVKAGTIQPQVGSLVLRGRALQIKTAQLNLQYIRLQRESEGGSKKKHPKDFNLLSGEPQQAETEAKGTA